MFLECQSLGEVTPYPPPPWIVFTLSPSSVNIVLIYIIQCFTVFESMRFTADEIYTEGKVIQIED